MTKTKNRSMYVKNWDRDLYNWSIIAREKILKL